MEITMIKSKVSNAFRLLGSGERGPVSNETSDSAVRVSNAFRLLGSGEHI